MQTVTTIGLDIAKSVFQVHGIDAAHLGDCQLSCPLSVVYLPRRPGRWRRSS